MPYYVYILHSSKKDVYYKGCTLDPDRRLGEHIRGECRFTSTVSDWKLVYLEECPDKRSALIRERSLTEQS